MSGHDEAGHAVGHAGSGRQEGDSHDDIRNSQRVTNDCDLEAVGRGGERRQAPAPPAQDSLTKKQRSPLCGRTLLGQVCSASRQRAGRAPGADGAVRQGPGCTNGGYVFPAKRGLFHLFLWARQVA